MKEAITQCMHVWLQKQSKSFDLLLFWFNTLPSVTKFAVIVLTNQEDRQLELVVQNHGVDAARSAEPGRDFIQEVSVEDEEEDAWAWSGRVGGRDREYLWERNKRKNVVVVLMDSKTVSWWTPNRKFVFYPLAVAVSWIQTP